MLWQIRRLLVFLIVLLSCILTSGCAHQFQLHISAGPCLNPPDHYCDEEGTESRVLEVRIYQLNSVIDPAKLDWNQFVEAGDADVNLVKGVLTDPTNPAVRTVFTIQRGEDRIERLIRLRKTKYFLVVTIGRHQGEHSIELVPLIWSQRNETLYFEYYDVDFRLRDRNPALIGPGNLPDVENP